MYAACVGISGYVLLPLTGNDYIESLAGQPFGLALWEHARLRQRALGRVGDIADQLCATAPEDASVLRRTSTGTTLEAAGLRPI
jgi:hypothetical protein